MSPTPHSRSAPAPRASEAAPAELGVEVNGAVERLPAGATVETLLRRLQMEDRRIAVAVNRDVVPRSEYATHRLADGDRVEVLEAVGGG